MRYLSGVLCLAVCAWNIDRAMWGEGLQYRVASSLLAVISLLMGLAYIEQARSRR